MDNGTRTFRAPARINVIGEHTDYNDGFAMPVNTAIHTTLRVTPRDDSVVRIRSSTFSDCADIDLDDIRPAAEGGWREYPKGVLHVLKENGFELCGADIDVSSNIPLGAGLSSSASLEVAVGYAMLSIAGVGVDRGRLAVMCQRAENEFVGMSCGIMDQYVIAQCERSHAMLLDCRTLEFESVPLPRNAHILVIDSGVKHEHAGGAYNERRTECEAAMTVVSSSFPDARALRDIGMPQLEKCRDTLGYVLYRRARHVVSECERVLSARDAMAVGDAATLGALISASHQSLRDDFEVSCAEVDRLVAICEDSDAVYGARMVGGGFGGCVIALVAAETVGKVANELKQRYAAVIGEEPWCHVVAPSDPVHEFFA